MQIMTIEVVNGDRLKELTPDQYAELRARYPEMDLPEDVSKAYTWSYYKTLGTLDDVQWLSDLGLKTSVSRVRGMFSERLPELGVPETTGVQIVNVTIPNAGLFSVQHVRVLKDECTDRLQSYLDKGWRIVAVCPPNDTRRPTYVIGHMDKEPAE